jgi:hypothetical protein
METVIGILLLLALCIWILMDTHRIRNTSIEVQPTLPGSPFTVAEVNRARYFALGLACMFCALAAYEWVNPSAPPFTERRSWLFGMLYYGMGPRAIAVFWALLGAGLGLFAFFKKTGARR